MLIQLVATALALSAGDGDWRARSAAVDTITAGHPSLRGKTFRLATDTMEVFIEREASSN